MRNRIALFGVAIGLSLAASVRADDNVRVVQEKLHDGGFYSGEIDGAYSSDLSAALTRYQIRNGLPISGQLDAETSNALGAKPAVGPSSASTEQGSETWQQLRKGARRTSASVRRSETAATEARETSSARAEETGSSTESQSRSARAATARTSTGTTEAASLPATGSESSADIRARSAPAATVRTSAESTEPLSEPPATGSESSPDIRPRSAAAATLRTSAKSTAPMSAPPATGSADEFSTERLRDYVGAFVLAGLDKNVGSETEFFADRIEYYDQGTMDRDKIREDLKRYDERWPERHFWFAGNITVEPQSDNRVRVTFPLGFKLRNGNKQSSGKVDKTLILEAAGEDLKIVP